MNASAAEEPTAVVGRYIDAFNGGDVNAMSDCFAESGGSFDGCRIVGAGAFFTTAPTASL